MRWLEMIAMGSSVQKPGRWLLAGMMVVVLGAFAGCSRGSSEGPTTYPVQGKVVAPGGKPWTGGRIAFQSVSDPGTRATGEIRSDGTFTLETSYLVEGKPRSRPGAVAGEHTVAVEEPGTTFDRDGNPTTPPHMLRQKYRVEEKENSFVIETPRAPK
jgi:hypothetical protein